MSARHLQSVLVSREDARDRAPTREALSVSLSPPVELNSLREGRRSRARQSLEDIAIATIGGDTARGSKASLNARIAHRQPTTQRTPWERLQRDATRENPRPQKRGMPRTFALASLNASAATSTCWMPCFSFSMAAVAARRSEAAAPRALTSGRRSRGKKTTRVPPEKPFLRDVLVAVGPLSVPTPRWDEHPDGTDASRAVTAATDARSITARHVSHIIRHNTDAPVFPHFFLCLPACWQTTEKLPNKNWRNAKCVLFERRLWSGVDVLHRLPGRIRRRGRGAWRGHRPATRRPDGRVPSTSRLPNPLRSTRSPGFGARSASGLLREDCPRPGLGFSCALLRAIAGDDAPR